MENLCGSYPIGKVHTQRITLFQDCWKADALKQWLCKKWSSHWRWNSRIFWTIWKLNPSWPDALFGGNDFYANSSSPIVNQFGLPVVLIVTCQNNWYFVSLLVSYLLMYLERLFATSSWEECLEQAKFACRVAYYTLPTSAYKELQVSLSDWSPVLPDKVASTHSTWTSGWIKTHAHLWRQVWISKIVRK